MTNTARILRHLRKEHLLTLREVAQEIGMKNHQQLHHIEQGRSPLPAEYVLSLAKLYNINPL